MSLKGYRTTRTLNFLLLTFIKGKTALTNLFFRMANFNIVYSHWFSLKLIGITIFFSKLANHSLNRNILNGMNFKRYSACFPLKSLQSSGQERNTNKQRWHNAKWKEFSRGTRKVRVLGKAPGRRWHLRSVRIWRCRGEERKRDGAEPFFSPQ